MAAPTLDVAIPAINTGVAAPAKNEIIYNLISWYSPTDGKDSPTDGQDSPL